MKQLFLVILLVISCYSFAHSSKEDVSALKKEDVSALKDEISALRAKLECVTAIVVNMNNERLNIILNTDKKEAKYIKKLQKINWPVKPSFKNDKNRKAWLNYCEKRIKLDFSEIKKWK